MKVGRVSDTMSFLRIIKPLNDNWWRKWICLLAFDPTTLSIEPCSLVVVNCSVNSLFDDLSLFFAKNYTQNTYYQTKWVRRYVIIMDVVQ